MYHFNTCISELLMVTVIPIGSIVHVPAQRVNPHHGGLWILEQNTIYIMSRLLTEEIVAVSKNL